MTVGPILLQGLVRNQAVRNINNYYGRNELIKEQARQARLGEARVSEFFEAREAHIYSMFLFLGVKMVKCIVGVLFKASAGLLLW